MKRYFIEFEVETDKEKGMIEAYLRYSLKMLRLEKFRILKLGEGLE